MKKLFLSVLGLSVSFATTLSLGAEASKFLTVEPARAIPVRAGNSVVTTLTVKINPEFHIQANPASRPNLIATTIDFPAAEGLELETITYPEGKTFRLQNSDQDLMVYGGETKFKVKIRAKDVKPGKIEFKGSLKFQPCNNETCFFPNRYSLLIPVQVVK